MLPAKALILFIKNPIPGKAKTRLAASVGDDMALRMYGILCTWMREQASALGPEARRYLYYSQEITEDEWPVAKYHKKLQQGADLGDRMKKALAEVFAEGHKKVLIIGSDCPGITTEYLNQAYAQLDVSDVVIGPAADGGYTLLGMRQFTPELFDGVAWSTEDVLQQTLARAEAAGRTLSQLPTLIDVDHLEDWYSYGWTLPQT